MKARYLFIIVCLIGSMFPFLIFAQEMEYQHKPASKENSYDTKRVYKDFRFAIGGGYSHRLGKTLNIEDNLEAEIDSELRGGHNFDFDAQYFFKEHWGVGVNIHYVKAEAKFEQNKKNIYTFYAGPAVSIRYEFRKFLLVMSTGFGPLFYKSKTNYRIDKRSINKVAFAAQASMSLEYKVSSKIGLGAKIDVTGGSIKLKGIRDKVSISNLLIGGFISFKSW